jgi:hypothetical protein
LFNNTSHNGNSNNNNSGSGDLLLSAVAKGMVASSLRQQQQSSSSSSSFAANHQNSLQNCSSSSATAENNTTSALNGGHIGSLSSVTSELRQIKKALADMQSEGGGQQAAGHHKVEQVLFVWRFKFTESSQFFSLSQLVLVLDSRMGRLEKQLEMALNSIYTLVQLQNGINNTLKAILAKT